MCRIALSLADKTIRGLIYVRDTHYRGIGSLPLHLKSMVIMLPWTMRGETISLPVYTAPVDLFKDRLALACEHRLSPLITCRWRLLFMVRDRG